MNEESTYTFVGCVLNNFGKPIAWNYKAETTAVSEKKAKANIAYNFKKKNGLAANAKITLDGKLSIKM